jgi:hypothetical protein
MSDDDKRALHGEESALVHRLGALPREIAPARDLWPAVEARIAPPVHTATRSGSWPFARAAAFALTVAGTAMAGTWLGYDYGSHRATRVHSAPAPGVEVERLELAFAAARENYLRQLALEGEHLGAPEREALRSQLAVIDRAVHQLRDAMAADPGNPLYIDSLLMTREREMEMLADISTTRYTRL